MQASLRAVTLVVVIAAAALLNVQVSRSAGPWFVAPPPLGDDANSCLTAEDPCATIQAAVDKASPGDTINIAAGTYAESVTITKSITIDGDGSTTTIVDPTLTTGFTIFSVTQVVFRDIQVSGSPIGGIHASNIGSLALSNVNISSNLGAGLVVTTASSVELVDVTLLGNPAGHFIQSVTDFSYTGSALDDQFIISASTAQHTKDPLGIPVTNDMVVLVSVLNKSYFGGSGSDVFAPLDTIPLGNGQIDGGADSDLIDFTLVSSPVAINLGSSVPGLSANLEADQERPANLTTSEGTAALTYDPVARTFDLSLAVNDLDPALVQGFHIHRAPHGLNGPIIVDLLPLATLVPNGTGFTVTLDDVPLPALDEAAFLGGLTYLNIHTPAFPAGQLRGQIFPDGNVALDTGSVAGFGTLVSIENATGGSGGDSIVGSAGANNLSGGLGADVLVGFQGADTMIGGDGNDIHVWSNGHGSDVIEDDNGDNDRVQVNGNPTAADTFTVGPGAGGRVAFARTSAGPFTLDILDADIISVVGIGGDDIMTANSFEPFVSDLDRIEFNGLDGSDTFIVTATPFVNFLVDGDQPRPPATPGDQLFVITPPGETATRTSAPDANGLSGRFDFTGGLGFIDFQELEIVTDPLAADMSIAKSAGPGPFTRGGTITYTIDVLNAGDVAARNARVTDVIPAGTRFVSASVEPGSGWVVTAKPSPGATGTVRFSNSNFAPGATATLAITVRVNSTVASGTPISNTATIASVISPGSTAKPTADWNPSNDSSTATVIIE